MRIKAEGYLQLYVETEFDFCGEPDDYDEQKAIAAKELKRAAREKGIPSHECDLQLWSVTEVDEC